MESVSPPSRHWKGRSEGWHPECIHPGETHATSGLTLEPEFRRHLEPHLQPAGSLTSEGSNFGIKRKRRVRFRPASGTGDGEPGPGEAGIRGAGYTSATRTRDGERTSVNCRRRVDRERGEEIGERPQESGRRDTDHKRQSGFNGGDARLVAAAGARGPGYTPAESGAQLCGDRAQRNFRFVGTGDSIAEPCAANHELADIGRRVARGQ